MTTRKRKILSNSPKAEEKRKDKKIKYLIRVFQDGTSEYLEGPSLENFFRQERAALSLLISHSWARPRGGRIIWKPLKEVVIKK